MNRGRLIAQAVSDRTNPVVVKELRQAVQNRLVIAILLTFLLANVAIISGYLLLRADAITNERSGQDLFSILFAVLVATSMMFVPFYAAVRLTMERNDANIDLLFITTIAPAAIIRGKFWAALALAALIYSASAPFLTFTYLLRGVDLPSVFIALGIAFLLTALTIMFAIFIGSVVGGLIFRLLMLGVLLFAAWAATIGAVSFGSGIVRLGMASMFSNPEAWAAFGLFALVGFGAWGLLYLLAVAAVSAKSSNRMFAVRVFVTVCWLVFGAIAGIWSLVDNTVQPMMAWTGVSVAVLSVALCFILAEREDWTPRVRRHIPRRALPRFLAWLFFTGSAGGVIWCSLLGVTTLLVGCAAADYFLRYSHIVRIGSSTNEISVMSGILLFAWCYTMSGLLVRRLIAPKSAPLVGTTIGMALLAICGATPLFAAYFFYGANWQARSLPVIYLIANPFVLERSGNDLITVFTFLGIWAICILLLNLSWFRQQWRAFEWRQPKPIPLPTPLAEAAPVVHA